MLIGVSFAKIFGASVTIILLMQNKKAAVSGSLCWLVLDRYQAKTAHEVGEDIIMDMDIMLKFDTLLKIAF